jgi:hypothetical protein
LSARKVISIFRAFSDIAMLKPSRLGGRGRSLVVTHYIVDIVFIDNLLLNLKLPDDSDRGTNHIFELLTPHLVVSYLFGDVVGFDSKIVLLRHAFQFPLFDHNN